jgi:hypothetical protein
MLSRIASSASLDRFACSTSKSTGTYSMNVAGMIGWTLTSLNSPPPVFASSTACVNPFGIGVGSNRSIARTIRLYMAIPLQRQTHSLGPVTALKRETLFTVWQASCGK